MISSVYVMEEDPVAQRGDFESAEQKDPSRFV